MPRVLLVSDMHYTTDMTHDQMKTVHPGANASAASGDAFGHTQREKIDKVLEAVLDEHAQSPLDAVLVLGDLSIDDYDWRQLPDNYCRRFRDEVMAKFPCPGYAIAGNHDSYPDAEWRKIFPEGRQFTVRVGSALFVMLDNFAATPASGASGSAYTPTDTDWLRGAMEGHDGEVYLCAHHFAPERESEEFCRLVSEDKRIRALFRGHTHHNEVLYPGQFGGKPLVDIGGYGYEGRVVDGKYTFAHFDFKWAWGYQLIEWDGCSAKLRHIKPAMHYVGSNGVFDVERTVEDSFEIDF
ncbi:MAG: metallophosphoesterase [Clostridia bacterium]|nr:metallophosphoesterase [Clostridia bacterium]